MRDLLPPAEKVAALLKRRGETVAIAESSAGGLITAALLAIPGASAYCRGGVVIYTRKMWLAFSGMRQEMLNDVRGASEQYALFQARTIRERFAADWGVGETGAAGPTGNRYGDAAGHVCLAASGEVERAITLETRSSDRIANMHAFAAAALNLLAEALET